MVVPIKDPVMQQFPFCSVYRTSSKLLRDLPPGFQGSPNLGFRVLCYPDPWA